MTLCLKIKFSGFYHPHSTWHGLVCGPSTRFARSSACAGERPILPHLPQGEEIFFRISYGPHTKGMERCVGSTHVPHTPKHVSMQTYFTLPLSKGEGVVRKILIILMAALSAMTPSPDLLWNPLTLAHSTFRKRKHQQRHPSFDLPLPNGKNYQILKRQKYFRFTFCDARCPIITYSYLVLNSHD